MLDAYIENLISEEVFRNKIKVLRKEENEFKKILAGIELFQMERECSAGYSNRVREFFEKYDEKREEIDFSTKKEMCGLLFKSIKIFPAIGGAKP